MELFRQTNIDFLRWKWWAIGASWALILVGLVTIFVQKGLRYGIDFAGGTQIALRFGQRPDIDRLRRILDQGGFGGFGIQRYEEPQKNEVLIRVQQQKKEGRDITQEVLSLLRQGLGGPVDATKIDLNVQGRDSLAARLASADPDKVAGKPNMTVADYYAQLAEKVIRRRSEVGIFRSPVDANATPDISTAIKQSFPFGVGAIVATIHDTLITVGLLALFGREFNLVVVAAMLTLVGYSVNDTVVVYDRIRENQRTPKKEPLETVINRSINQTLSRTILTSGATMLVVLALFVLGGEVLNTFALTLIIGIIIGTYSSIYVASPIIVIWKQLAERRKAAVVPVGAGKPASAPPVPGPKPAAPAIPPPPKRKKSGRR